MHMCTHCIDLNQLIKPEGSGDASTSLQWKKVLLFPLCVFEVLIPVFKKFFESQITMEQLVLLIIQKPV